MEPEKKFFTSYMGLLHSKNYRRTFAHDLKKMLPRIPLVDAPKDFWGFSKAGKDLAHLPINYEQIKPTKGVIVVYSKIPKGSIQEAMEATTYPP